MAGLGRRTHYRKHLTDSVLHDFPEPQEDERIAKVVASRGSNQFDVLLPHQEKTMLAILPTKFRKLVWVKRNDFVIVQTTDEGIDESDTTTSAGTIRCIINHILYKEQVNHLKTKGLWPEDDPHFADAQQSKEDIKEEDQDGIVYEHDDDLFINTNRIASLTVQDSSSSSSSDDEES